jgi:hypothetical protein
MTTANNADYNLSPWKPGQSGNPSGRPKGTRDLAGYVLESTGGGRELVNALLSIARGVMPNVPVQEGSRPRKDQQVRASDQLKAIESPKYQSTMDRLKCYKTLQLETVLEF